MAPRIFERDVSGEVEISEAKEDDARARLKTNFYERVLAVWSSDDCMDATGMSNPRAVRVGEVVRLRAAAHRDAATDEHAGFLHSP